MSTRIFTDHLSENVVRIEDSEAHHLLNVLRMTVGGTVELFDGSGTVAAARIEKVSRRHADLSVLSRTKTPESTLPRLTVAAAPAKGDRLKWMVEKLTELGVHQLILLHSERVIVNPGETKLEKLRSTMIAACKQSGRTRLLHLQGLTVLDDVLNATAATDPSPQIYLAHPYPSPDTAGLASGHLTKKWDLPSETREPVRERLLFIGPEGGFTDAEVSKILQFRATQIVWPDTILRIETAAVTFGSLLMSHFGNFQINRDAK